jgi:hypothetical protein
MYRVTRPDVHSGLHARKGAHTDNIIAALDGESECIAATSNALVRHFLACSVLDDNDQAPVRHDRREAWRGRALDHPRLRRRPTRRDRQNQARGGDHDSPTRAARHSSTHADLRCTRHPRESDAPSRAVRCVTQKYSAEVQQPAQSRPTPRTPRDQESSLVACPNHPLQPVVVQRAAGSSPVTHPNRFGSPGLVDRNQR